MAAFRMARDRPGRAGAAAQNSRLKRMPRVRGCAITV